MQFRRIRRLSSSAFGGRQLPSQVFSVLVARVFTSSSSSGSAGLGLSAGYSPLMPLWQHKESRKVPVSVWWDFETCDLPARANVFKVAQAITATIRSSGIRGPITITAFGEVFYKLPQIYQDAFESTGIVLHHFHPINRTSDVFVYWATTVPPPAHIFLISSDTVFAGALRRLRWKDYNILLASKTYALDDLFSSASIMWDWCSLVEGKSVAGICFNPPAPYAYKPTLVELSDSVKTEESIALSEPPLRLDSCYGPSTPFDQRVAHTGVSIATAVERKPSGRPRNKMKKKAAAARLAHGK